MQFRFVYLREHSIVIRLIEKYLNRPYHWYLNHNTSKLTTKLLAEVNQVVHGALFPALQIISQGLVALFIMLLLVAVDPALTFIAVAVLLGAYFSVYYFNRNMIKRLGESARLANQDRFHIVQEAFGGIKDVKIAGIESNFVERLRSPSLLFASNSLKHKALAELPSYMMQGLVFGGMMLILLYLIATRGKLEDALPVIVVYAFAAYRLMPSLQALYRHAAELRFSTPKLDVLHSDLLGLETESCTETGIIDNQTKQSPGSIKPKESILLDSISYSYPHSSKQELIDVSIRIPVNSTIGLVGASGSGKTTLVDIVLGLLTPSKGHIYADSKIITHANIRSWQKNLGYVPQQIFLTDDSVTANIAFGVPEDQVDHRAVKKAAKLANLHDFIVAELAKGYMTEVGERGIRLSGGQRQRIGIARALYHDPGILLLDEATSALDNLTEKAVMDAVNNLGSRKTIILVAHRLSTVKHCDCIYFMEEGKVVASGDYKMLKDKNLKFREMAG
jgi:ABC-type bacteriocin/lantibiotic exporter with double-glycine peptidase domain